MKILEMRRDSQTDLISADQAADVEEIAEKAAQIDAALFPGNPWGKDGFLDNIKNSYDTVWFAVSDIEKMDVCGYAILRCVGDGEVLRIAVSESYRRLGIGDALLAEMLKRAAEEKMESVFLEVREGNVPAIGLYKKAGFENAALRKNYYSAPVENALIMRYIC